MSRKKTQQEYIDQVAEINSNIVVLGTYNGNKKKIQHQCKRCEHIRETQPLHIIQGHGCPECAKKQRPISKTMSHNDFVERANILYPDIEIIGEYVNTHHSIEVRCKKCGHIWKPKAATLLIPHGELGGTGCKKCYTSMQTKNTDLFIQELSEANPDVKLIGNYINSYTKTLFKCYGCDKLCEWETSPSVAICGCKSPLCVLSNGEAAVLNYLEKHNIQCETQKTFKGCKHINLLRFDFYLPEYNCCIEYDGEQHYYPVNFRGCSDNEAIQAYESTQYNDSIKNEYCKHNNIDLIRIPFFEFKNIDNILTDYLNKYEGDSND